MKRRRMNDTSPSRIAAVTGASGFIGSHICQNLLEHGYLVRACVRKNHPSKIKHLLALADSNVVKEAGGRLEVCVADMSVKGAYDEILGNGCEYLFHVAGNFGTDYDIWKSIRKDAGDEKYKKGRLPPIDALWKEIHDTDPDSLAPEEIEEERYYSYDHAVYESYVVAMEWLLLSVAKHQDTIQRVIYTSSGAAGGTVTGPAVPRDENIIENAYGWAKHDCEAMLYDFCKNRTNPSNQLVGVSVCPCIVMGPMMGTPPIHDSVYQHRMADMLRGKYTLRQHWGITDVRDVAETHRLAAEAPELCNGTRFLNGSNQSWWVSDILKYIVCHEDFQNEKRFCPIFLEEDDEGTNGSSTSSHGSRESDGENEEDSNPKNDSDSDSDKNNDENDDKGGDGESRDDSSSSSASCSSDDSYGISEWDKHEPTTIWSDPVAFFSSAGYTPRTPQQTVLETAASVLDRWDGHGRELTLQEYSDYYTVGEMDGCEEEMKWLADEIRLKTARK